MSIAKYISNYIQDDQKFFGTIQIQKEIWKYKTLLKNWGLEMGVHIKPKAVVSGFMAALNSSLKSTSQLDCQSTTVDEYIEVEIEGKFITDFIIFLNTLTTDFFCELTNCNEKSLYPEIDPPQRPIKLCIKREESNPTFIAAEEGYWVPKFSGEDILFIKAMELE